MTATSRILLLLLPALCAVLASEEECTIDCLHDTVCVKGKANFTWHPVRPEDKEAFDFHREIERNGWHCGCPPGLTGLRCGRKYETCNDGEHVCYNGGQCIATMKDIYQNDQLYCDCAATVDENGNKKTYSGKYCEVEITESGNRCDPDQNPCQNGGTCSKTADDLHPCECKEGYVGRMCEFFEPSVPKCSLKCQNGGTCRYGTKEEDHDLMLGDAKTNVHVVHENFQYCECPDGYSGVVCETEETLCGTQKCLHGSTCVTVNNKDTGETTHHCDCAELNKKKLANGEDVQYAGRHCEIESTTVCHYKDDDSTTFCAHEGTCPDEWHEHCDCPEGWHGAHCQFKLEDLILDHNNAKEHESCKLQCKNGGSCRKGTQQDQKVQDLIVKYGSELPKNLNISYNEDFEHCACPDGFVGLECEYSMTQCGENGELHPCFHGSTCKMVGGEPVCICDDADTQVAGTYCQHLADAVCTLSHPPEYKGKMGANGNRGFCVNGGICVTNAKGEAACRCHTDFEGPHCEYEAGSGKAKYHEALFASDSTGNAKDAKKSKSTADKGGLSGGAKFGITLTTLMCLGVVGIGYHVYRKKKVLTEDAPPVYPDLDNNLAMDDQSLRAAPVVDVGPEKDFDGNELKNVELL